MQSLIPLIEICLLAFLFLLWWIAKRDLSVTAARQQGPALKEIREVQETIEGLLRVLEQKTVEIEARLQERFDELVAMERLAAKSPQRSFTAAPAPEVASEIDPGPLNSAPSSFSGASQAELSPIEQALRLIKLGHDPRDVARSTGLTLSEIETAARMRELRAGGSRPTS